MSCYAPSMDDQLSPKIASFVIRFVVDEDAGNGLAQPACRGSIRHVQSDETRHFSAWREAVTFIRRYVPIEAGGQE